MTGIIRTTTLATALAVAATLTACTKNEEPPVVLPSATTAPSAPSPTTSAPPATPQQQIVEAYLAMQNAFAKASETADPDYPDLSRYAAGTALTRLRDGLRSMRDKGLRARGETIFHPKVESVQPATAPSKARVRDCMDTSKAEAYKANGDPYKDTPGGLRLVIADLERTDGAWKVTGLGVHEVGSCV